MWIVFHIVLFVSILINIVLLYRVFDLGVTTTHGADEIGYRQRQALELEKILPLLMKSISKDQVLLAAKQSGLDVFDKPGDGTYVGTVLFSFSENKVTAVDLH